MLCLRWVVWFVDCIIGSLCIITVTVAVAVVVKFVGFTGGVLFSLLDSRCGFDGDAKNDSGSFFQCSMLFLIYISLCCCCCWMHSVVMIVGVISR